MNTVILNAAFMHDKHSTHNYLAHALGLPAWYGFNLDALYDCLGDMRGLEVHLRGSHLAVEQMGSYAQALLDVFRDLAQEGVISFFEE